MSTGPDLANLPADVLDAVLSDPLVQQYLALRDGFWYKFIPRPDRPAEFDQQASFCQNKDTVSMLVGGNAAGTTEAAAFKTAQFVLNQQQAPRRDTPFWIISETYEQVCDTCWKEKLLGNGHIPPGEVDWGRISWLDKSLAWPKAVPLMPWAGGDPTKNWLLEFKSYKQGRKTMQARSIGGFWFSEQFPWALFLETLRGCRNYFFPGSMFAEFTPIEPELCLQIEKIMERPPAGWKFYRANTEKNRVNLAGDWYDNFFATVSDEMRMVRQTGALAMFQGLIYPQFQVAFHVHAFEIPKGAWHRRATDWGASEEHPFTTVWGCRDAIGDWWIYDEYWSTDQTLMTQDHAENIKKRWTWPEDNPFYGQTFADPSRPGEINEFNIRGIPCSPASNDVFKGIECIRGLLKPSPTTGQPRLHVHPRCKHLIEEFRKYRWLKAKAPIEGSILNPKAARPEPLKRDDDVIDALRYLIFSDQVGRGATISSGRYGNHYQNAITPTGERSADVVRSQIGKGRDKTRRR